MNSDGSDRVKIADNAREPCWSPDGKSVAYLKGEFAKYNLQDFATRGIYIYDLAIRPDAPAPQQQDRAPLHAQLAGRRQVVRLDRARRHGPQPRDHRDREPTATVSSI